MATDVLGKNDIYFNDDTQNDSISQVVRKILTNYNEETSSSTPGPIVEAK